MIEFAPAVYTQITYDTAWLYCSTLEHNGYRDWRLPTYKEWCNSTHLIGWYENARPLLNLRVVYPVRG
jgi:hypothetical protein